MAVAKVKTAVYHRLSGESLAGQILLAQESERSRIAKDLHDDIGATVALCQIHLQRATASVRSGSQEAEQQLQGLESKLEELGHRIAFLSHQLHCAELELLGLTAAIQALCREYVQQYSLEISCSCDAVADEMEHELALCLYRVLQESLRNVVKHSGTKTVSIVLCRDAADVKLRVADRGVGFSQNRIPTGGLGLLSMRERLRLVAGELSVLSRVGKGTVVEARVPWNGGRSLTFVHPVAEQGVMPDGDSRGSKNQRSTPK